MFTEDCPFKVVRTNGGDEVLARGSLWPTLDCSQLSTNSDARPNSSMATPSILISWS
jgi:hypothetical protein